MAVIKHTNGRSWVSFNTTAEKANDSVSRKAIYHLELYDRFHGAGFTKELITPLDELSPYGFRGLMRDIEVARCAIIHDSFNIAPYNQVPEAKYDVWVEWREKNPAVIEGRDRQLCIYNICRTMPKSNRTRVESFFHNKIYR